MKNVFAIIFLLVINSGFAANPQLQIGEKARHTDVKMENVSGDFLSLDDLKRENGLLLIFSCNTCPFVIAWEDRYNEIYDWAEKHQVGMAVLNSNYQKRTGDDSLDAMKEHAIEKGYRFSYLVDKESLIANAFGGQTTPHVFLFDNNFRLVYKGAIDDNFKNKNEVKRTYLKDAIECLSEKKPILISETKPLGCSIKRKID